jgi:hypothetical protein
MHPLIAPYRRAIAEFRGWLDTVNLAEVLSL